MQGGELISSCGCDYMTADVKFLLSRAKYKATTDQEQQWDTDVLCYQVRQPSYEVFLRLPPVYPLRSLSVLRETWYTEIVQKVSRINILRIFSSDRSLTAKMG